MSGTLANLQYAAGNEPALEQDRKHEHAVPMQTGTAIRETIYTGSYLGLCPVLQTYIDKTSLAREGPPGTSLVVSGISTGMFASFVTQPIDTAKTRMQAFIDPKVRHPLMPMPLLLISPHQSRSPDDQMSSFQRPPHLVSSAWLV